MIIFNQCMYESKKSGVNLIKLTAKEKKYVISEWHHAKLSYFELHPTEDERYEDMDLTKEEIEEIIKRYGVQPPQYHWYWTDRGTPYGVCCIQVGFRDDLELDNRV